MSKPSLRIRMGDTPYFRWSCFVCGGQTEKDGVVAVAYNDLDKRYGMVCRECIEAGEDGFRQRAGERSQSLRELCDDLDMIADGRATLDLPPTDAWEKAIEDRERRYIAAETEHREARGEAESEPALVAAEGIPF